MPNKSHGQYSVEEIEQRLQRILHGAFAGPPTPLKDIPKKNGELRTHKKKPTKRRKHK